MKKFIEKVIKIGGMTHKILVPMLGSLFFVVLGVVCCKSGSFGFAVDGVAIDTNFDSITKGWCSYIVVAIFIAWLLYLISKAYDFICNLKKNNKVKEVNKDK
jgi:hypothetical protein